MNAVRLVFLLEERSAKVMLQAILPKLVNASVQPEYITFEGKSDLDRKISRRIINYNSPDARFLILRDQDQGDCRKIKTSLLEKIPNEKRHITLVRIACRELESFYLGDLQAVEAGVGISGLAKQQQKSKYRQPDRRSNAKQELTKITNKDYKPVSGSRAIAPHLNLDGKNHSSSFNVLVAGIKKLAVCE